jgi:hypothetical protein
MEGVLMRYRCYFSEPVNMGDLSVPYVDGDVLAELKDGFWVNEGGLFTCGGDAAYWVPPSAIRLIEKLVR